MKILLLYASFGEGHKKAAFALKDFLGATCKDFLDFSPPFVKKIYSFGYLAVTGYIPFLWKFLFFSTQNPRLISLIEKIHYFVFSSFRKYLREFKPRIVIATHFFPPFFLGLLKEQLGFKVIVVVTDMDVHPLWANRSVDFYFTAGRFAKEGLASLGVEEKKVICGFAPLRSGFLKKLSSESLREKFSLDLRPCLIFVSSTRGRFPLIRKTVPALTKKFNLIVIYGRNKRLKKYLGYCDSRSVRAFSFYEEIWELFSLSSVIISKPGGLTVFEGVYLKKPFIFTDYIPGQEKANMDLLIRCGVAKFARNAGEFNAAVEYFLEKRWRNEDYPVKVKDIRPALREVINKLRTGDL